MHLLDLVRERGTTEPQSASLDLTTLTIDQWTLNHWAPSGGSTTDSAPGRRPAGQKRGGETDDLPYGLDVWRGLNVLCMSWSERGDYRIVAFIRGDWEEDALELS